MDAELATFLFAFPFVSGGVVSGAEPSSLVYVSVAKLAKASIHRDLQRAFKLL